jgi:hypothetical protein
MLLTVYLHVQGILKGTRESKALRHYDQDKSGDLSLSEFMDLIEDEMMVPASKEKLDELVRPFMEKAGAEFSRLGFRL